VRPTIWPLVFSLAGAAIVAGVLASRWVLVAGAALTVAAAAGWFREVLTQRRHHGPQGPQGATPAAAPPEQGRS
jgi:hypothetical protein